MRELIFLFGRLGLTSFGGPAAHIAMMEEEVVTRRAWLTRERFLDLVGVTNLIPGPNSTELAMHLGYLRGGFPGLIVAGFAFLVPAVCITVLLAWGYVLIAFLQSEPVAGRGWLTQTQLADALAGAIVITAARLNLAWIILGGALMGALVLG